MKIELAGIDGFGGALYIGTGCFHRRESLSGKYYENRGLEWNNVEDNTKGKTLEELEMGSKPMADCTYENGTLWGKEVRLIHYKSYYVPLRECLEKLKSDCKLLAEGKKEKRRKRNVVLVFRMCINFDVSALFYQI